MFMRGHPRSDDFGAPVSGRLRNRLRQVGIGSVEDLRRYVEAEGGWARLQGRPQIGPVLIAEAAAVLGVRNPLRPDEPPASACPHCGQILRQARA